MSSQTTNLHLVKPAYSEAADVAVINSNMDTIDTYTSTNRNSLAKAQSGLAYIVGNTNTTGGTLPSGTYVYVKGHSSISEGLRVTTASISNNGNITTNNTSAVSGGGLNAIRKTFEKSGFDYIPTTTAELKAALADMISNAPNYGFAFFLLRTSDMNNSDILPKNNFGCIVEKASTSMYGSILIFTYGQPSKIYKFSYSNGDVGYSFVHEFSGTQIANW